MEKEYKYSPKELRLLFEKIWGAAIDRYDYYINPKHWKDIVPITKEELFKEIFKK